VVTTGSCGLEQTTTFAKPPWSGSECSPPRSLIRRPADDSAELVSWSGPSRPWLGVTRPGLTRLGRRPSSSSSQVNSGAPMLVRVRRSIGCAREAWWLMTRSTAT
jgi:hypothetical protein